MGLLEKGTSPPCNPARIIRNRLRWEERNKERKTEKTLREREMR